MPGITKILEKSKVQTATALSIKKAMLKAAAARLDLREIGKLRAEPALGRFRPEGEKASEQDAADWLSGL